jgi:uridine kinase
MDILRLIEEKRAKESRLLITIDGPCASGKTTLAQMLADACRAAVVHTDDFVIPHAQKTPRRLAIPGGNCDADRIVKEVAAPWKAGGPVVYRRYDCRADRLLPPQRLPDADVLILEGSYCNLPAIRAYAGLRLFMNTPEALRMERLRRRESPEALRRFREIWIPLENAYFEAYRLPDAQCVLISGPAAAP